MQKPEKQHRIRLGIYFNWMVSAVLFTGALVCLALSWFTKIYVPWPCGIALIVCAVIYASTDVPRPLKWASLSVAWIAQRIAFDFWSKGVPDTLPIGQLMQIFTGNT